MDLPSRRSLVAALLAVATPAFGATGTPTNPGHYFPYLSNYLMLPPAERTHFAFGYAFSIGGRPLTAPMWIVEGAKRTPVPLRWDGQAEQLPTLEQLKRGLISTDVSDQVRIDTQYWAKPVLAPATVMEASELTLAIAQAAIGARKAAGYFYDPKPTLYQVEFVGVASGEVQFADGRSEPLPFIKHYLAFDPSKFPGATTVRLATLPRRMQISWVA